VINHAARFIQSSRDETRGFGIVLDEYHFHDRMFLFWLRQVV
jgi:hypothetical protein